MSKTTHNEAMLGFRRWIIKRQGLACRGGVWTPGINESVCRRLNATSGLYYAGELEEIARGHPAYHAPNSNCSCGLYAWHTLERLRHRNNGFFYVGEPPIEIFGAVAGWGPAVVHNTGWRAQYARILAIAVAEHETPFVTAVAQGVAQHHGVPLVPFDMLQLEGARHASGVPEALIPEPEPEALFIHNASLHIGAGAKSTAALYREMEKQLLDALGRRMRPTTPPSLPVPQSPAARHQSTHARHAPARPHRPPRNLGSPGR